MVCSFVESTIWWGWVEENDDSQEKSWQLMICAGKKDVISGNGKAPAYTDAR
jgi:hypothetical protein